MKLVGITGGIGSGKTTVSQIFSELGFSVYNADDRAKKLMHSDDDLINRIKQEFGEDIYSKGVLDRKKLASSVFNNPEKLKILNSLVHPAVAQDFEKWCQDQQSDIVLKEAAILFETGGNEAMDETILVHASEAERVDRVCKRDNVSENDVRARINNQWSDQRKLNLADHQIQNENGFLVLPQVMAIIEDWRK